MLLVVMLSTLGLLRFPPNITINTRLEIHKRPVLLAKDKSSRRQCYAATYCAQSTTAGSRRSFLDLSRDPGDVCSCQLNYLRNLAAALVGA